MKTYSQEKLIHELSRQTEIILEKAISDWQLIPHSKFARKPTEEGWSANECLQHLNSYGRYYLPAMEKSMEKATKNISSGNFLSGWLGHYFTRLMLPDKKGGLSSKMNSPKDHRPRQILESHLVLSEFIDQQEKLLRLLEQAKSINLNKAKVGISIAPFIKLKLGDVFCFLIAHLIRHTNQAERALAKTGLPERAPASFSLTSLES